MTKRLLTSLLAIVAAIVVAPVFVTQSSAATTDEVYNVNNAIAYAEDNWDNGRGLCAQFVSECLNAGGVDAYGTRVVDLYNELINNNYGKVYKLTLTNGKNGSLRMADNNGKIKKGDPIFYFCNVCKTYEHVVLCNGVNSKGYIQDYAHNKAHNGKKQTYTFDHCGTDNWTFYSVSIDDENSLITPEITGITAKADGVEIKWNPVRRAEKYTVYKKVPGGKWVALKNVKTTEFIDKTAENGATYNYTVKAVNGKIKSAYKTSDEFKYIAPVDFKSASVTDKGIKITWEKNDSASGYHIYRLSEGGKWTKTATLKGGNKTSYTDTNVDSGKNYRYRVRAYSGSVTGAYHSKGISTYFVDTPVLKSCTNSAKGVTIKWNAIPGAGSYRVYRRGAGESWQLIKTVKNTVFEDTTAENSTVYRYTVRAVCKGVYSTYESGIALKHIKTPGLISTVSTDEGIILEWEKVEDVNGYYVYRKAAGDKGWTRVATVKDGEIYTDTNVVEGVEYTYTVRAYFGSQKSSYDAKGIVCKYIRRNENEIEAPDTDTESDDID